MGAPPSSTYGFPSQQGGDIITAAPIPQGKSVTCLYVGEIERGLGTSITYQQQLFSKEGKYET